MRNIEIKAKICDTEALVTKLKHLAGEESVIKQHDIFFKSEKGRLKLRRFENGIGELIYYERADETGPKLSNYRKTTVDAEMYGELKEILASSNGIIGTVTKIRQLFIIGQTRIHVDEVYGLGSFVEFEVVLSDNQDSSIGEKVTQDLMSRLGIKENDLVSGSYMDLLNELKTPLYS